MIRLDPDAAGVSELRARVCVVGSGAGGAAAAAELAAAGIDTLLLEAGAHHDPASFDQREAGMMARLYAEGGQRLTEDQGVAVLQGEGLGGSTVHNTGLCVPPPEAVLDRWRREGALGWSAAEIDAVSREVLARMEAAPPPEASINRNNRLLETAAREAGLATVRPLHARRSCSGCGYCILGCAYNKKRNALFSHLEPGISAGLRVATGARVSALRRRGPGAWELRGPGFVAACERVVLAASATGTPALLRRHLRRGRGGIGRSLRLHPFAPVGAVFDEPVDAHRGIPQSVLVTGEARFLEGGPGGFVLMAGAAGPGATAATLPMDRAGTARILRRFRHLAVAGVLLHDHTAGRVDPARDGRPRLRYWPGRVDRAELLRGIALLARLWLRQGAREVLLPFRRRPSITVEAGLRGLDALPFRPWDVMLSAVHPQGGAPLGADATRGAVDPRGRLFAQPEIVVADGSLFPGSVGVPPQVTIMTLATLAARGLAAELGA